MKMISAGMVFIGLIASTSAHASEGDKTIAIGGNLSATHSVMKFDGAPQTRATSMAVTPTLDVLVAGGLSLGASLQFARSSSTVADGGPEVGLTYLQPGAQVGYFVPIGEHAAFWPVARAGYGFNWYHAPNNTDATIRTFEVSVIPQVLLLPTKSFFVRFAPGMLAYRTSNVGASTGGILGMSPTFLIGVGVML